jgi:hypothetical protein
MTTNEIREIVESIVADQQMARVWYFIALPIIMGLAAFFGAYLTAMGKNRAAKEYIGRITEETQKAIKPYAEQLVTFTKELERRNALEEKGAENAFVLSATSHMAQMAFDKHVEFCEKYVAGLRKALFTLFRCGPTEEAGNIADHLYQIRSEFALWETRDVAHLLNTFENALLVIGLERRSLSDETPEEERVEVIRHIYEKFQQVMALQTLPDKPTPAIAINHIVASLQDHLGVSQLTELRKHYLAEAAKRIESR